MRPFHQCATVLILALLTLSVFIPFLLLSHRLRNLNSHVLKELVGEDLSVIKRQTEEVHAFSAVEEVKEEGEWLKEPPWEVYKDVGNSSGVGLSSFDETNTAREHGNAADEASSLGRAVGFNSGVSSDSSDETNRISERGNAADGATSLQRDTGSNSFVSLGSSDETNRTREPRNVGDDSNSLERDVGSSSGISSSFSGETSRTSEPENAADVANLSESDVEFNSGVSSGSSGATNRIHEPGNAANYAKFLERNGTNNDRRGHINKKGDDLHPQQDEKPSLSKQKDQSKPTEARRDQGLNPQPRKALDEKIKRMIGQIIRAKAYLQFIPPSSKSQFPNELRFRIREVERALGDSTKDSDLPRWALRKMEAMEASLLKASRIYRDCPAMDKILRTMTYNAEAEVRGQKDETTFLFQLIGRTSPKGLHCLSMRLTSEFFALEPEERELPNQHKLHDPALYHFAVFSDNILASAVVVNSTVSNAQDSEKIVFHIVTDSLNAPAMTMWFLQNPPGKAAVEIQSIDNFGWLSVKYEGNLQKQGFVDLRFTSPLDHLRFYLPDIFPRLNKIVLLDHDVVVQRDLTGLWKVNMEGKVNGAVETCQKGEPSFQWKYMFINFTDRIIAKSFDVNACTWAFGMNIFDLQEWRRQDLTGVYHKYLQLGTRGPLVKASSLPIGWMTFYKQTVALDRKWHVLGLGYDSGVEIHDIQRASVIHFDGIMKPWLDIGLDKYSPYWKKYINYQNPYFEQCNLHR